MTAPRQDGRCGTCHDKRQVTTNHSCDGSCIEYGCPKQPCPRCTPPRSSTPPSSEGYDGCIGVSRISIEIERLGQTYRAEFIRPDKILRILKHEPMFLELLAAEHGE